MPLDLFRYSWAQHHPRRGLFPVCVLDFLNGSGFTKTDCYLAAHFRHFFDRVY